MARTVARRGYGGAGPDNLRKEARNNVGFPGWITCRRAVVLGAVSRIWIRCEDAEGIIRSVAASCRSNGATNRSARQTGAARGRPLPASAKVGDLPRSWLTVERIVSSTDRKLVAEVDVAPDAAIGERGIALGSSTFKDTMTIYDRVDYVKVTPESSMAAYGDQDHARGFQQYEAIGYQKGPDSCIRRTICRWVRSM